MYIVELTHSSSALVIRELPKYLFCQTLIGKVVGLFRVRGACFYKLATACGAKLLAVSVLGGAALGSTRC